MTAIQMLLGLLVSIDPLTDVDTSSEMLNFWFYMLAMSLTGMTLALALKEEQRVTADALSINEERLKIAADSGQLGVWEINGGFSDSTFRPSICNTHRLSF